MKIYILSPYLGSGGPRALHNLCDTCIQLGLDAYICYFYENPKNITTIYPEFSNYNINVVKKEDIEQNSRNWIIIPEYGPWVSTLDLFKNMKRAYWWLSVDNNQNMFKEWDNNNILHLYQTTYSLMHIIKNNGKIYLPLMDPIHDDYFRIANLNKENIICYNPLKDKLTPTIKHLFNYESIPLIKLSRRDVFNTLQKSKIYIDFGHHPGRENIPREACILRNIIITTSQRGSAQYFDDMPISPDYKFKDDEIEKIVNTVNNCIINYDTKIKEFRIYRNLIRGQKNIFHEHIKQIFKNE